MQPLNRAVSRRFLLMTMLFVILSCAALAQKLPPISPSPPTGSNNPSDTPPGLNTLSMLGGVPVPGIVTVLGTVTGKVTLDDGSPAVGFTVYAVPAGMRWLRDSKENKSVAVTDNEGRYSITLHPMQMFTFSGPFDRNAKGYSVSVSRGDQMYVEPSPQDVDPDTQPNHIVTDVNFVMQIGPQIVVHVHDAITGAPIPGLKIHVDNDALDRVTGPDGSLRFRVPFTNIRLEAKVPEDQQHTLEFAPGYRFGEQTYQETTGVPGQDFVWDLKTYGTTDKSDWHGIVLGPNGRPVAGVPVTILRENTYPRATVLRTDMSGQFSIQMPRLDESEQVTQGYSVPPVVYARLGSLAAAQIVTPGESWNGMTLHLASGASISGILTDLNGNPAAGVSVSVTGFILGIFDLQSEQPMPSLPRDAVTNNQGFFTVTGLPPGNYQVQAHGGGYGTLSVPAPVSSPTTIVQPRLALAAGERKYMGTLRVPHADKVLVGTVVDTQGQPAQRLFVRVTGAHTDQTAATQTDGTFRVNDVVDEPVRVEVGVPEHEVTAQVASGQITVRLVAAPDVVATNGLATPPTPIPPISGPVTASSGYTSIPLNALVLNIEPSVGSMPTASVIRLNSVDLNGGFGPLSVPPCAPGLESLWHGTLADLDGMRLAVRHNQGKLTDQTGRVLWSGVVVDAPDYTIISDARGHGHTMVTVRDGQGKTLWSGQADPDYLWQPMQLVRDGNIRIFGPHNTIAWERGVGNARVAMVGTRPDGYRFPDWRPMDGTLTLHFETLTGTLRASDGHVLWSGPAPTVTATAVDFPAMPPASAVNATATAWWTRQMLLPPDVSPLVGMQNVPHGAVMSYADPAGHILPLTQNYP